MHHNLVLGLYATFFGLLLFSNTGCLKATGKYDTSIPVYVIAGGDVDVRDTEVVLDGAPVNLREANMLYKESANMVYFYVEEGNRELSIRLPDSDFSIVRKVSRFHMDDSSYLFHFVISENKLELFLEGHVILHDYFDGNDGGRVPPDFFFEEVTDENK